MPPPKSAELSLKVLSLIIKVAARSLKMPPPKEAELPLNVLLLTSNVAVPSSYAVL